MERLAALEHAGGMNSAHPAAGAIGRRETVAALGPADVTRSDLVVGASELAEYGRELDRLRAIRDRDLRDRLRRARGFVGADAAEEIAHIYEDNAVIDARIARLEALVRTATVLGQEPVDGVASLGCTVEVEYERTG